MGTVIKFQPRTEAQHFARVIACKNSRWKRQDREAREWFETNFGDRRDIFLQAALFFALTPAQRRKAIQFLALLGRTEQSGEGPASEAQRLLRALSDGELPPGLN
jgi:hypothetical protein